MCIRDRHQPVQWRPWGETAFSQAQSEDKPILLDIGAVSVSYTHLDVYKRQVVVIPLCILRFARRFFIPTPWLLCRVPTRVADPRLDETASRAAAANLPTRYLRFSGG